MLILSIILMFIVGIIIGSVRTIVWIVKAIHKCGPILSTVLWIVFWIGVVAISIVTTVIEFVFIILLAI